MCSPTIHPGSFRCSLHKHRGHGQATPYLSKRRSVNKSSLVVRLGTVESDLLAKRALAIHIRPSSHSLRRRFDFQLRSSRLSQIPKPKMPRDGHHLATPAHRHRLSASTLRPATLSVHASTPPPATADDEIAAAMRFSGYTTICEARAAAMRFSLGFNNGGEDFDSRLYQEHLTVCASSAQLTGSVHDVEHEHFPPSEFKLQKHGEFANDGLVNESSSSQRVWVRNSFRDKRESYTDKTHESGSSCFIVEFNVHWIMPCTEIASMQAMETVVKQNNLDIEALMSSRLPSNAGMQVGDSSSSQLAGSSQRAGITRDSKAALSGTEIVKPDAFSSSRPPSGHGIYQGSATNINADKNQKENEDVASIEGEKKDESSSKERDGISIERNKDCCDDKPSLEAEQHGHLYFQFCDTLSPYWRIPFIEKTETLIEGSEEREQKE
nr:chromatin structure-remodeling complex protein SYD [Ipomoea batatas]